LGRFNSYLHLDAVRVHGDGVKEERKSKLNVKEWKLLGSVSPYNARVKIMMDLGNIRFNSKGDI